ncbi:hypothetical protein JCM15548_12970 [Geofilum rubicundum JCM 15548]|uniref:Uncharacterized protein n=2 Tax=Geofilum TaxID=1236988 RepID=A0A0E9LYL4_9BACT|nr:hypothetical protein JCM15548_12970 [Geofilum rubicundum JCM 15548]
MGIFVNAQKVTSNYVVTHNDTLICQDITVGAFKTTCTRLDGETIKMANKDVLRYAKDGKLMQRMPVYVYNQKTKRQDMMELIDYRNQVAVYKHEFYNGSSDHPDVNFYFYVHGDCIEIQKNPQLDDIKEFVMNWNKDDIQVADQQLTKK